MMVTLARLPEILTAATFAALVLVVDLAVAFRYLIGSPLVWSDEVSRLLLIWMTFLGAALGVKRGAHFAVTMVVSAFPPAWRRWLSLFAAVSVMAFAALFAVLGVLLLPKMVTVRYVTIDISAAWAYLAVPVSAALMVIYAAGRLVIRGFGGLDSGHG